jgi:hypothetical protein
MPHIFEFKYFPYFKYQSQRWLCSCKSRSIGSRDKNGENRRKAVFKTDFESTGKFAPSKDGAKALTLPRFNVSA